MGGDHNKKLLVSMGKAAIAMLMQDDSNNDDMITPTTSTRMFLEAQKKAIEADAFHLDNGYLCHSMGRTGSRGIFFGDDPIRFTIPGLLLQLSIISLCTRVAYFLLKPFGQPSIVSQILGGVVLGPSILGHNRNFLAEVFPARSRVLLENLSVFSLMLFIFLLGVKMNLSLALRSGKKPIAIGILGFIIPYAMASLVACLLKHFVTLDRDILRILPFVIETQCMSAFPVIACFLADLKILNSEIGRLASSSSVVSDVFQWSLMTIRFAIRIAKAKSFSSSVGSFLSVALFIVLALYGIRPAALWAIRKTPEGQPVKEKYIIGVLLALLGCGFIGEVIGLSAVIASFIVGLVIPDGPPLGAALSEKLDSFVSVLLMPIFFAICGLQMDVFAIQKLKNVGAIQLVVFVAFIGKVVGTIAPPLFYRMPFRDALSLSLIMNAKGLIELVLLNHRMKDSGMTEECFAIMIISVVFITGVLSPIVKAMYDPSRRYVAFKRRTIRHHKRDEELRILACVHSADNVREVMNVVNVSSPTKASPINLTVMHLIRLIGRSSSLLVAHQPRESYSTYPSQSERIFNAFRKLEQVHQGLFMVQCFKGISPYASMHNDVCSIALEKRTSFIIIPFQRKCSEKDIEPSFVYRNLNKKVLDKAPCSVGVLVDHGGSQKTKKNLSYTSKPAIFRVAVLFFGGQDDREALAYGMRMSENPRVNLTLIKFSSASSEDMIIDSEKSRLQDGDILSEFSLNTLHKEDRTFYEEMILINVMSLATLIKSLENSNYDLILVGRRHKNSKFMSELLQWSDCTGELGPVGEMLTLNYKIKASIMVVQQQTRVWGLHDPEESTHLRRIDL
ncbi:cation/H(+) antiporter 15-like [Chenopodium quinoa]|uniref:Cation/H+ exchanger domain-containing protein n=1 Tax=Chenopodium quinoa TaxID=63459 RepID=A0A803MW71_CHEQI|nr:cation/H(+) antiporter 15-like [Chenopodium quinoa]